MDRLRRPKNNSAATTWSNAMIWMRPWRSQPASQRCLPEEPSRCVPLLYRTVVPGERMSDDAAVEQLRAHVDALYRAESRHVLATLIRLLKDFDLAEEALHEAFTAAMEQWPRDGIPANPRSWLVSAGRFKAIDGMRRRARFDASLVDLARHIESATGDPMEAEDDHINDDRLRLIFTCCHPSLGPEARMALTLREVCGLTTEEVARAFLASPPTI